MPNPILQCPICNSAVQVTLEMSGQTMQCPTCRQAIQIPSDLSGFLPPPSTPAEASPETSPARWATEESHSASSESDSSITATCQACKKPFGVTPEMAGQSVACPFCQFVIQIPGTPKTTAPTPVVLPPSVPEPIVEPQESVDETELFAPGFAPIITDPDSENESSKEPADTPVEAEVIEAESLSVEVAGSDIITSKPTEAQTSDVPGADVQVGDERITETSENEVPPDSIEEWLREIEHPALPPKFISRTLASAQQIRHADENTIFLPSADGGVQAIDRNQIGIPTKQGRILVRTVAKEKKESKRSWRSLIVYMFCLVILVLVLFLLMKGNA